MKPGNCARRRALAFTAVLMLIGLMPAQAADFTVSATSAEFAYTINKEPNNPVLTLVRGRTYTFEVETCTCHPFEIRGAPDGTVINNNISSGTIIFNVPPDPVNYTYVCSIHLFGGLIVTEDPPPADYTITATAEESAYTINQEPDNPELILVRGRTYTFSVNACSCHPFEIVGAPKGSVINNNIFSGIITFNVPVDAVNYSYVCSIHFFGGIITTVDPPLSAIETWRQTHFGSPANSGDGADTFDFDKDGLPNLVEFAFDLNPKQGGSLQLPAWQVQGGNFSASFAQPASVEGVIYGAEWSENMASDNWTVITDTGSGGQHSFSVQTGGHTRVFVRLTVTRPGKA